jgi:hypothetical protein
VRPRTAAAAGVLVALTAGACGGGFQLAVGDCVRLPASGAGPDGLAEVTQVDCDEPHELEVFHVFELGPEQTSGQALVTAIADTCLGDPWLDYVGTAPDETSLELLPFPPTDDDLDRGDREVVCTVREPGNATRTGSVRAPDGTTA